MAPEALRDSGATPPLSRGLGAAVALAASAAIAAAGAWGFLGSGAPLGNDNSSHFAEILHIAKLLGAGETDFWFDQANLGYPLFLAYQPAPSLVMGALVAVTGSWVPPLFLFKLSIVLLWCGMPLTWFVGARWLGLGRAGAASLSLFVLAVNDLHGFGLGLVSLLGNGLYTQSWGALLLPLTLGAFHRHVVRRELGPVAPALLLAATLLCHAFLGLYAGIAAAVMTAVHPAHLVRRSMSALGVVVLAVALSAFWLIPFLANLDYQGGLPWKGPSENGYPLADLGRWLLTGALLDHGRPPLLTLLAGGGAVRACLRLRHGGTLERWMLLLLGVTLALLPGRTTWGAAYGWLPLHSEIEVVRYLSGLQWCSLLLAAYAVDGLAASLPALLGRLSGPGWLTPGRTLGAAGALCAAGFLVGAYRNADRLLTTFDTRDPGFRGAVERLRDDDRSRFVCSRDLGTASHFCLNLAAALSGRPQLESFARGYHDTLSLYYLEFFDFSAVQQRLFNVGAAVARDPSDFVPSGLVETWRGGDYRVLERPEPPGYFGFVRLPVALAGGLKQIRRPARVLAPVLFERGCLPRLPGGDGAGEPAGPRVVAGDGRTLDLYTGARRVLSDASLPALLAPLRAACGSEAVRSVVLDEEVGLNTYVARVDAASPAESLLLKVSHHPYWTAAVDGEPVPVLHVAPNLMAVQVPPGRHEVRLRYRNPAYQKLLFLASLGAVVAWVAARLVKRRRGGDAAAGGRR